jgi:hypothetical protein
MEMNHTIEEIYKFVQEEVKNTPHNTVELRNSIVEKLDVMIQGVTGIPEIEVICDEVNNPPTLVYSGNLRVRLEWKDRGVVKKCDLDF